MAAYPTPLAPARPTAPRFLAPRKTPEIVQIERGVSEQIAKLAARVKIVEERIDNLRSHIELVDGTVIEKHKAVVSEIRTLQDQMRGLRSGLDEVKSLTERIVKRLEAFASKEEVKVLERYVDAWQPLNYVTRSEVKSIILSTLKEQGIKVKGD